MSLQDNQQSADFRSAEDRSKPRAAALTPGLYLVATPIGNLRDITLRALDVLSGADSLYCEDSRITRRLLNAYDIQTRLAVYHEHNAESVRPRILAELAAGQRVALVSDAGMPLVSDPGYKLVREVLEAGHRVIPLPGPSAPVTGLVASGLPTDRFLFAGFPPQKAGARQRWLSELEMPGITLILFESPNRLAKSLADMAALWPEREAVVARELTKMYEEFRRDRLDGLAAHYAEAGAPKGEIVVLLAPLAAAEEAADLDTLLGLALESMSLKDAVAHVTRASGEARKTVYARALELNRDRQG